jgi:Gpi18-like mannosyltransferase
VLLQASKFQRERHMLFYGKCVSTVATSVLLKLNGTASSFWLSVSDVLGNISQHKRL